MTPPRPERLPAVKQSARVERSGILLLLVCTILVTTGVPLLASFYFLDDALDRSLNLGFNPRIEQALDVAAQSLKTLKTVDAANAETYRLEFEQVAQLRHVYSQPGLVKSALRESLKVYFGVGLVGAALMAVMVAVLLARRIHRSYQLTFAEMTAHAERARYLEQMASWQELARILAHEIKNPLTPIEVMVTALTRAHVDKSPAAFGSQLAEAQRMIREEISHLKRTVGRFSEFARLPPAQLALEDVVEAMRGHLPAMRATFPTAQIDLDTPGAHQGTRARIDSSLLRQVLANIVSNGVEANPGGVVHFTIRVTADASVLRIAISNDGKPVDPQMAAHMFDPYISGKAGSDNVGLGLTIVKKIVIEHGGSIAYAQVDGQPCFTIKLQRAR